MAASSGLVLSSTTASGMRLGGAFLAMADSLRSAGACLVPEQETSDKGSEVACESRHSSMNCNSGTDSRLRTLSTLGA